MTPDSISFLLWPRRRCDFFAWECLICVIISERVVNFFDVISIAPDPIGVFEVAHLASGMYGLRISQVFYFMLNQLDTPSR